MALVVEDGTIVAGANSFMDLADIESYFDDVGLDRTSWDSLSTTSQEATALRGVRYHETEYGPYYMGIRRLRGQPMSWPRRGVAGLDGYEVAWTSVPDEVKWAQAELTHRSIGTSSLLVDVAPGGGDVIFKKRVLGPIETEDRFSGVTSDQTSYAYVDSLLLPYLDGGPGVVRVVRA